MDNPERVRLGCGSVSLISEIDSEAAAAAHLYGLLPEEFIAARNAMVKELRASDKRELAAVVALLRRPTVMAAEMNRVLRLSPQLVEALIECADAVRTGHQEVLEGATVDLASRLRSHRLCASELAEMAERDHNSIQSALEGASLDEALHPQLRAGTFATEPAPQAGFDLLTPTATVTSLSEARARRQARRRTDPEAPSGRGGDTEPEAEPDDHHRTVDAPPAVAPQQHVSEAEAQKTLELTERRVASTAALADKATARVEKLTQQLAAAQEHQRDAEAKLDAAKAAREAAAQQLRFIQSGG